MTLAPAPAVACTGEAGWRGGGDELRDANGLGLPLLLAVSAKSGLSSMVSTPLQAALLAKILR